MVHKHWSAISTEIFILKDSPAPHPDWHAGPTKPFQKTGQSQIETCHHRPFRTEIKSICNNCSPDPAQIILLANLQHHQHDDSTTS